MSEPPPCGCAICSLRLEFDLDPHLVSEIEKQNCVVFAGSGISTETRDTHPDTLYGTLKYHTNSEDDPDFWDLVDRFEAQPNGRHKLIQIVRDRFDYIDGFRDLRWAATRFHRGLGNAPYLGAIITTNWDTYFEDVIGATPFVYDSDIPFWENAKRPVLKIHGSIDNYSSIVASTEDYEKCEERLREGPLGAVLKQIFATKTCIFCGYSARDKDFRHIFSTIQAGLGQFARNHYLISPFVTPEEAKELLESFGIIAIRTDASYFVDVVKSHMQEKFCFSSDDGFASIEAELAEFRAMHQDFVKSYSPKTSPHLIYATAYQDGVIHAFERIIDRALTGEFADLHAVQGRIAGYGKEIKERAKARDYWNLAYFNGYQNGLLLFILLNDDDIDELPDIPECFHPGQDELYLEEFNDVVWNDPEIHKASLAKAKKITARFADDNELVVQHLPWG
jgi:hypothetical protein